MNSQAAGLDHVGVVGRDLAELAEAFSRIGFTVTPRAIHAGGRTGNHCVMLDGAYLEVMAVVEGGTSATIDRFLARYAGIHTLAFSISDEAAVTARLHRAGIEAPAAAVSDRAVDASDPEGPHARFTLITPPDIPEGRIHLIRHLTPDALWQPRFLAHPNQAMGLTEVLIAAASPAKTAARLSRVTGRSLVPDPEGGYALELPSGRVRIVPPGAAVLGGRAAPCLPWIAGVTVATRDGNAAVRGLLTERGVLFRAQENAVLVEVAGVGIRFVPD